ncbi:MAG: HU family DNA-binding protein [Parabacteroides merdae]
MIKYKRIQMPSKGIEARPIQGKQVSTKEIATEIEKVIGIPAIRTMSVLSAFVEMAYNHFENGEPVVLEGFGTFKTGLAIDGGKVVAKKST